MINSLFMLLIYTLIVLITRPISVLIHELGHAIPAILLTRKSVSIYLGSYGDPNNSFHFRIWLLDIWFKYNPFLWRQGLCVPSSEKISVNKQIIYTLTGPLASFIIAISACYFTFTYDLHGLLKLILIIFLGFSIIDLVANLSPRIAPIKLYDGSLIYNDGYQLTQLFHYKKFSNKYLQARELYSQQKFAEAAISFKDLLKNDFKDENIYRLAIYSLSQLKDYETAKDISDEFAMQCKMNSNDFEMVGFLYLQLEKYDRALEFYDKSLELNPNDKISLNNKGYILTIINKFEESIPFFNKAIEIDSSHVYSYNNRGLAKIKIGKEQEGLEDINFSIQLDENNSYAYRNLGIYHLDQGEYLKAQELFRKAKDLDSTTLMIEELINNAQSYNSI